MHAEHEYRSIFSNLTSSASALSKDDFKSALSSLSTTMTTKKIEEAKSQAVEKSLYLYSVDEYTGKSMYDASGVYPVKIDVASDLMGKYMPMMRIGLQAASVANGAAALVNVFCPFVPSRLVPKSFVSKAQGFVDDLDKPSNVGEFGSVQNRLNTGEKGGRRNTGASCGF